MEIQFTRTTKDFLSIEIEPDAIAALLDEYRVGGTEDSLSDRLWTANSSHDHDAFWSALADQAATTTEDSDVEWWLEDDPSDDDEEDDDEDDEDDEEEFDVDEFDADTTLDLSALVS